jgi:hypothetical protein
MRLELLHETVGWHNKGPCCPAAVSENWADTIEVRPTFKCFQAQEPFQRCEAASMLVLALFIENIYLDCPLLHVNVLYQR